jgi:hypothetical protein
MVVGREIVGGGPTFRSVFVFDHITDARPPLLFELKMPIEANGKRDQAKGLEKING